MNPIYSMEGVGELLEVYDDKLTIRHRGVVGFLRKGVAGITTISFLSIAAIHFTRANLLADGTLQFSVPGGNEKSEDMWSGEHAFMFPENNELALVIEAYIEKRMVELHQQQSPLQVAGLADEIRQLAEMRNEGILTDEEFQAAKHRLIGA